MVRVVLIVMGVLTATPVLAVIDPGRLGSYGVVDPDLVVLTLLQHRGVLQLALGAALVWAAVRPDVRVPIAAAAITTKGVGLALTLSRPEVAAVASPVPLVFDAVSIVVLSALVVDAIRRRRVQAATP